MIKDYSQDFVKSLLLPRYNSDEVTCLHPEIIINPSLGELLSKYQVLVTPGKVVRFHNRSHAYFFLNTRALSVSKNRIDYDNYKESYVLDESSGETFPVYLLVPCNHCDLCLKSRIDAFAHRCVLESMCYDCLPWFLTLTYRDSCLPKDGVSVDDIQRFLKRFRINLSRAGYDEYIRYTVHAEYAPPGDDGFRRPHYHMIVWNLHPKRRFHYKRLFAIAQHSWSLGFCYNELVSPKYKGMSLQHPEKCFEYVAKYIGKSTDEDTPENMNPIFHCSSNRNGGIGAPFLDKYVLPTIRKTLDTSFKYLDIFSGNVEQLYFHRYILNRCFPTFYQSIPYKFRKAYRMIQLYDAMCDHRYRHDDVQSWFDILHNYLPTFRLDLPDVRQLGPSCLPKCPIYRQSIDRCLYILDKLFCKCDFCKSIELDSKRKLFVSRMLSNHKKRDLSDISYKFRRSRDLTKSMHYDPYC